MTHARRTLTTCLLAAIALMACTATAAQAEGEWTIDGKTMSELKLSSVPFTGELESGTALALSGTVGKTKVAVECTKLEVKNGLLLQGGEATAESIFSNCTTFINGTKSAPCALAQPLAVAQRILLKLHRNKIYSLVDPNGAGGLLGTMVLGEECAVGEEIPLKGTFVYECPAGKAPSGECDVEQLGHLFAANATTEEKFNGQEEESQVLPNDEFFFLDTPATWYERWILRLAIAYEGHTWRGTV